MKTTTPEARTGNPQPHIAILKDGVINSVGLTNPGVDAVVNEKLPRLRQKYPDLPIIGIDGVETVDDVLEMFLAGSSAIGIGAAHFNDQEVIPHLAAQLEQRMDELKISSLEDLRSQVRDEFRNEN